MQKFNYMNNQYGGFYAKKSIGKFIGNTFLEGGYITDLFKFSLDDSEWIGYGLPSKNASIRKEFKDEELIRYNIKGLKHEIKEVMEVEKDPIIILMGKFEKHNFIIDELKRNFPNSKVYGYSHYAARKSASEFIEEGNKLLNEISKDL